MYMDKDMLEGIPTPYTRAKLKHTSPDWSHYLEKHIDLREVQRIRKTVSEIRIKLLKEVN